MTRPFYETSKDRAEELIAAKKIAAYFLFDIVQLKPACHADFGIIKSGKVIGVMEVKRRKYTYDQMERMGGLMISAVKMQSLMNWKSSFGLGIMVGLQLSDGIYAFMVSRKDDLPMKSEIRIMGRTDRGDDQDMEPCVLLPMSEFTKCY